MDPLTITLRTLTPLWTGGVETGKMERIHETGIIGSLRWWYEAIVRGLGGHACDPTTHACIYNNTDKPNNGLCDVCQMFGATGWRRRFSMQITAETSPAWKDDNHPLNIRPYGRIRGWYLQPGQIGTITIHLTGDLQTRQKLKAAFLFMEKYGNLGARPQLGYGRFQIIDIKNDPGPYTWEPKGQLELNTLPDLRAFTFFTLQFQPRQEDWWQRISGIRQLLRYQQGVIANLVNQYHTLPTTPTLKNHLRFNQTPDWSPEIGQWLFGTLKGNYRLRSKISLSWAYRQQSWWQIDGWVYLPPDKLGKTNAREIAQRLQQALHTPQNWLSGLELGSGSYSQAQVQIMPADSPWTAHTPSQITHFLNQTNSGDT